MRKVQKHTMLHEAFMQDVVSSDFLDVLLGNLNISDDVEERRIKSNPYLGNQVGQQIRKKQNSGNFNAGFEKSNTKTSIEKEHTLG